MNRNSSGSLTLNKATTGFLNYKTAEGLAQRTLQLYLNQYLDFLIPIIQRGIDSGELRAVDPREVAIAMGAIIEGTVLLWVYDRDAINPERHVQSGFNLLLEGIMIRGS